MQTDIKLMVRQFKALSNEHRFRLMLAVLAHEQQHGREQGCLISELVSDWSICAPTVSHHLRILEAAQLIDVEKNGKYLVARMNRDSYEMKMRLFRVQPLDDHMAISD